MPFSPVTKTTDINKLNTFVAIKTTCHLIRKRFARLDINRIRPVWNTDFCVGIFYCCKNTSTSRFINKFRCIITSLTLAGIRRIDSPAKSSATVTAKFQYFVYISPVKFIPPLLYIFPWATSINHRTIIPCRIFPRSKRRCPIFIFQIIRRPGIHNKAFMRIYNHIAGWCNIKRLNYIVCIIRTGNTHYKRCKYKK